MWDACKDSAVIREGASEEDPEVRNTDTAGDGEYTVCWDPLDGSSIVDGSSVVDGSSIVDRSCVVDFGSFAGKTLERNIQDNDNVINKIPAKPKRIRFIAQVVIP